MTFRTSPGVRVTGGNHKTWKLDLVVGPWSHAETIYAIDKLRYGIGMKQICRDLGRSYSASNMRAMRDMNIDTAPFIPNAEDHAGRWHRHAACLKGITSTDLLTWSSVVRMNLPMASAHLMSRDEIAYMTRRLALGDAAHMALKAMNRPHSPSLRRIPQKIQRLLLRRGVIIRPTRKYPILNSRRLASIVNGSWVPPEPDWTRALNRHQVYRAAYLRQVVALSRVQMQRVTGNDAVKRMLSQYGLWANDRAEHSRSYTTGRKSHRTPLIVEWVHPIHLSEREPLTQSEYVRRVRHFTNVMVRRHGHRIAGAAYINMPGHVVDHILSIRHGWQRNGQQVPWQMLCHPANLQVLSAEDNNAKGAISDFSPDGLNRAITKFNREHGTVLIPIDTATLEGVRMKYAAIAKHRRSA